MSDIVASPADEPEDKSVSRQVRAARKPRTHITPEVIEKWCWGLKQGYSWARAAMHANTSLSALDNAKRARKDDTASENAKHVARQLYDARESYMDTLRHNISQAGFDKNEKTGQRDWRAHQWLMSVYDRERYGSKQSVEVTATVSRGPDLTAYTVAELAKMAEIQHGAQARQLDATVSEGTHKHGEGDEE